jgi:ABC-2 type transport system ATP-binding protein
MQEVQALCDRVVVINKGRIVADDHLENVLRHNRSNSIVVEFEGEVDAGDLRHLAGVVDVQQQGPGTFRLSAQQGLDIRPEIFRFAADRSLSLVGLRQEESSLESIFRSLTSDAAAEHSEN